jgi:hypothetical protein
MEYTVINNIRMYDLIDQVNNYIKAGWKPLGGISAGAHTFCQAMTRE